jgi:hypothetical protein
MTNRNAEFVLILLFVLPATKRTIGRLLIIILALACQDITKINIFNVIPVVFCGVIFAQLNLLAILVYKVLSFQMIRNPAAAHKIISYRMENVSNRAIKF